METKRISLVITEEMHRMLDEAAEKGSSMAAIIREGAASELKRRGYKINKKAIHPPRRGGYREGAGRKVDSND